MFDYLPQFSEFSFFSISKASLPSLRVKACPYLFLYIQAGNKQPASPEQPGHSFMSSVSDEMQLFHSMLKKLMGALAETVEMYEDFVKIHSSAGDKPEDHFIRPRADKREEGRDRESRGPTAPPFSQRLYEEKMRREQLNRELEASGKTFQPKETLSCKQRLAALRSLNKHVEKEHEPRSPPASAKEGKNNTAFFLYLQEKRESMAREYPELKPSELSKIIAENWRSMSEEERKPFYRENVENRKEFDKTFHKCLSTVLRGQRKARQQEADAEEDEDEDHYEEQE